MNFYTALRRDETLEDSDKEWPEPEGYWYLAWRSAHRGAIRLTGKLRAKKAVPHLIKLLDGRAVRRTSALALAEIGDKRAIEPLLKVIEMTRYDVDKKQLAALKQQGAFAKIEPLLSCVRDYDDPEYIYRALPSGVLDEMEEKRKTRQMPKRPCKIPEDMRK